MYVCMHKYVHVGIHVHHTYIHTYVGGWVKSSKNKRSDHVYNTLKTHHQQPMTHHSSTGTGGTLWYPPTSYTRMNATTTRAVKMAASTCAVDVQKIENTWLLADLRI